MFRNHIDDVFEKFVFKFVAKQNFAFDVNRIDSFVNRSYDQFSFTFVDALKFLKMKILDESMISLNNETKNKIYLNLKKFNELISLFENHIDEIFAIIRFIIVSFDINFYAKFATTETNKQNQQKYIKIVKLIHETIEKIIKTIRQIVQQADF